MRSPIGGNIPSLIAPPSGQVSLSQAHLCVRKQHQIICFRDAQTAVDTSSRKRAYHAVPPAIASSALAAKRCALARRRPSASQSQLVQPARDNSVPATKGQRTINTAAPTLARNRSKSNYFSLHGYTCIFAATQRKWSPRSRLNRILVDACVPLTGLRSSATAPDCPAPTSKSTQPDETTWPSSGITSR